MRTGAPLIKRSHHLVLTVGCHGALARTQFDLYEFLCFGEGGRRYLGSDGWCRTESGRRSGREISGILRLAAEGCGGTEGAERANGQKLPAGFAHGRHCSVCEYVARAPRPRKRCRSDKRSKVGKRGCDQFGTYYVQTSLTNHALLASTWFYAVGGRGARATLERFVSKYHSLERPRCEYRRRLPHYQSAAAPLFVTFGTFGRWTLPEAARDLVLRHCLHDHGRRIQLSIAVVMPNHVHLLFWALRDGDGWSFRLVDIMHSLKSASAHSVNRLLRREGPVWDEESFDHVLRSDESWEEKREYIRQNPVEAGLVRRVVG